MTPFSPASTLITKRVKPPHEEIACVAMLVDEMPPIRCSCCGGKGVNSKLWGTQSCSQCGGSGYDWIGSKTMNAVIDMMDKRDGIIR